MQLVLRRVILFTRRMREMSAFYRDGLGLEQTADKAGWKEFAAGGCSIALHSGANSPSTRPAKIVFFAEDVAAARALLVERGVPLGKVRSAGDLDLCDGKDPDGNPFQLCNRA